MTTIKMITQYNCVFCERASALFAALGLEVEKVVLDTPEKKSAFKRAGHATVPVIYVNGFQVGGYSDIVEIITTQLTSRFPAKP